MQWFVSNAKKLLLKSKKCAYTISSIATLFLWVVFTITYISTRKIKCFLLDLICGHSTYAKIDIWRKLLRNMLATYSLLLVLPQCHCSTFRLLSTSLSPVPLPYGSCVTALAPLPLLHSHCLTALAQLLLPFYHCSTALSTLSLPHCPFPTTLTSAYSLPPAPQQNGRGTKAVVQGQLGKRSGERAVGKGSGERAVGQWQWGKSSGAMAEG